MKSAQRPSGRRAFAISRSCPTRCLCLLRFNAITAEPGCRYELIIEPGVESGEVSLELPVFAADASCATAELDGYVYLLRGERPSVAARDEDRSSRDAAPR